LSDTIFRHIESVVDSPNPLACGSSPLADVVGRVVQSDAPLAPVPPFIVFGADEVPAGLATCGAAVDDRNILL
jgi:hypothetical protein